MRSHSYLKVRVKACDIFLLMSLLCAFLFAGIAADIAKGGVVGSRNIERSGSIKRLAQQQLAQQHQQQLAMRLPKKPSLRFVCENTVSTLSQNLAILSEYLTAEDYKKLMKSGVQKLAYAQPGKCASRRFSKKLLSIKRRFHNKHLGKIGIILPDSSTDDPYSASFKQGLMAACKHLDCDPSKDLVFKHVPVGNSVALERVLAQLILKEKVAILIGGFDEKTTEYLNFIAEVFRTPTFLIRPYPLTKVSTYSFYVSPSQELVARSLLAAWQKRGIKSVALLQPHDQMQELVSFVKEHAKAYGIHIATQAMYHGSSLDSMQDAVRHIFELKAGQRQQEWEALLRIERQKAEGLGEEFVLKDHYLEPKIDFGAVLIPDNIKIARHFAKLFRYYRLKQPLTLTGTHLWRAKELAEPWDDMFQRAFFVDFIGSYLDLPSGLFHTLNPLGVGGESPIKSTHVALPTASHMTAEGRFFPYSSPGMFIDPSLAAPVDFQLQGWRAMLEAVRLKQYFPFGKAGLAERLREASLGSEGFFKKGPSLYDSHHTFWPSYVFELSRGGAHLERSSSSLP